MMFEDIVKYFRSLYCGCSFIMICSKVECCSIRSRVWKVDLILPYLPFHFLLQVFDKRNRYLNCITNKTTNTCTLLSYLAVEVSFQQTVYTTMESGDTVEVCVILSGMLGRNVTISLSTSNGSAIGKLCQDYRCVCCYITQS